MRFPEASQRALESVARGGDARARERAARGRTGSSLLECSVRRPHRPELARRPLVLGRGILLPPPVRGDGVFSAWPRTTRGSFRPQEGDGAGAGRGASSGECTPEPAARRAAGGGSTCCCTAACGATEAISATRSRGAWVAPPARRKSAPISWWTISNSLWDLLGRRRAPVWLWWRTTREPSY